MKHILYEIHFKAPYTKTNAYCLDDKDYWTVGISNNTEDFDITVFDSEDKLQLGYLTTEDGFWFYVHCCDKIESLHNGKRMMLGLGERKKVYILEHDDELSFVDYYGLKHRFMFKTDF